MAFIMLNCYKATQYEPNLSSNSVKLFFREPLDCFWDRFMLQRKLASWQSTGYPIFRSKRL